jgi:membrane protease YdiL (CAAX protease family)
LNWREQHQRSLLAVRREGTSRRLRAFSWFLLACLYAGLAHQFAFRAALALAGFAWFGLVSRLIFLALVLVGFAAMGRLGQRQPQPLADQGLAARAGWGREWALGAALGWAGIVACVLPAALIGGLLVSVNGLHAAAFTALILDLLTLAAATLLDEVLFRGYAYQRLIDAIGPVLATMVMAVAFTLARSFAPSGGSVLATLLLGFLLAMAYLRTRALWVGWGFHFAWNASMAVLFGLPVSGLTSFSPLVTTYTEGPAWLTGGGYGPEGSAIASFVLLLLMAVLAMVTRDLRHRWALPEIVGAGIPVDIDAAAQKQHEQGMGPAAAAAPPAGQQLVQIAPAPEQDLPPGR